MNSTVCMTEWVCVTYWISSMTKMSSMSTNPRSSACWVRVSVWIYV